jgi:N-ethylmaleimide reductase
LSPSWITDRHDGETITPEIMTTLLDALKLGNFELKNRILMAPMTRGRADAAGNPLDIVAAYYAQRASAGLLITEAVNISPMTKANDNTPGIYTAGQIECWKAVATAVHKKGGKILMQIVHTGRLALPDFLPGNVQPVSASAIAAKCQNYTRQGMKDAVTPRELTVGEINQTVNDFAMAAKNAIAAGFDGVELHAAYGYLIHQFLGTNSNVRTDEYGGSDENRSRFLLETVDAIVRSIGSERVGIRLSPSVPLHDMEDANAKEFYPYVVRELNSRNLAYLHIATGGAPAIDIDWHEWLRPVYNGVYFANGGFTKESGEKLLARNGADAIVFGKLFIANPDLPERFEKNARLNTPDQSTFYTPGEKGYTDYPSLEQLAALPT